MNFKSLSFAIVVMLPTLGGCQVFTNPPISHLAVKVVDETGSPVSNAYVEVLTYWDYGWDNGKSMGFTGTNGVFRYEDRVYREISYNVNKKGYYKTLGEAWWPKECYQVPETNLVVELKRILAPLPLMYRRVWAPLPRLDKAIPFDLEVGDWVFPDGNGKVADFWISGTNQWISANNFDYFASLSVSNAFDGIISIAVPSMTSHQLKSELRPPQRVPESGYERSLDFHHGKHKEPTGTRYFMSSRDDRVYVFRVRSETNEVGEIVSANVGWMEGRGTGVSGKADGSLGLGFEYYYNPDPTSRSLEPKEIADQQAKDIPKNMK